MKTKAYKDEVVTLKPIDHAAAGQYEPGTVTCYFNGKDITGICVEADKPEGWADVIVMCNGKPLLDDEDEIVITRIHGLVELTHSQRHKRVKMSTTPR